MTKLGGIRENFFLGELKITSIPKNEIILRKQMLICLKRFLEYEYFIAFEPATKNSSIKDITLKLLEVLTPKDDLLVKELLTF